MSSRTVRLDEETDEILQQLKKVTGLSISEILKRGIHAIKAELSQNPGQTAFAIFESLDLGPGGHAIAPSTSTREGVRNSIRKKLKR